MNTEPEGNFDIVLNFGNQSTTCDVRWTDALYNTSCVVPGTSRAGDWGLSAIFDGVEFFTTDVRVQCAKGYFEKPDDTCETCPRGTECLAGSTLLNLPVLPGFWRSGGAMPSYWGGRSKYFLVSLPAPTQDRPRLTFGDASLASFRVPAKSILRNAPVVATR